MKREWCVYSPASTSTVQLNEVSVAVPSFSNAGFGGEAETILEDVQNQQWALEEITIQTSENS